MIVDKKFLFQEVYSADNKDGETLRIGKQAGHLVMQAENEASVVTILIGSKLQFQAVKDVIAAIEAEAEK